jgi:hypothetical protein
MTWPDEALAQAARKTAGQACGRLEQTLATFRTMHFMRTPLRPTSSSEQSN